MSDEPPKPKRKPRVVVPCRMTEHARDVIDQTAAELGENRSEFIRQAAYERIQRHHRSKK